MGQMGAMWGRALSWVGVAGCFPAGRFTAVLAGSVLAFLLPAIGLCLPEAHRKSCREKAERPQLSAPDRRENAGALHARAARPGGDSAAADFNMSFG